LEPRLAGGAQASERSAQRGAGDPRGAGDVGPDPGPHAGAEDRKPAELLGPADGARRAAGSDEGVRARTVVAAREPDRPLPGRRRRRRLVRDWLGWRPLPGARAEEGEPRWEGGGKRARVVHAVG